MQKNIPLLTAAHQAYDSGAGLRSRRNRFKEFTYGRQWGDMVKDPDGHLITEGEMASRQGRQPLTNNMLRQLVKTIVGRFRSQLQPPPSHLAEIASRNMLDELDSRLLEEFLISGCAIQRICTQTRPHGSGTWIDNVNPGQFFINTLADPRGTDVEMVGMLHDFSLPELLARFSGGSPEHAARLSRIYTASTGTDSPALGLAVTDSADFFTARAGRCRVIEVWTLDCAPVLRCHDPHTASYFLLPASAHERIRRINASRQRRHLPQINARWEMRSLWQGRWLSPSGHVLQLSPSHMPDGSHPFVTTFYPLTDGEVHPFVEDVIDQQKYINRLITLIDNIMGSSAKGVLLFPEQQLCPSMDWTQVRDLWAAYDGVIPYRPRPGEPEPHQVASKNTPGGAYELLSLQLKLFEEISGVSGALQGRTTSSSGMSAQMFEAQARNSAIALADIFATFATFRARRNARITPHHHTRTDKIAAPHQPGHTP